MSLIQPIRNFFDFANPQFFSVLGRRNKRFYADCIVELYRYITMMTSFCSQDDAITVLSTVAGKYNGKLEQEDLAAELELEGDAEIPDTLIPADGVPTPKYVYKRLRNCGWIEEIYSSRRRQLSVFFTTEGDGIASQMLAASNRADKIALGGYVRNIISDLEVIKTAAHPYSDGLRLAMESAQSLMRDFRGVVTEIHNDIDKMVCQSQDTDAGISTFMQFNAKYAHGILSRIQQDEYISPTDISKITILLDEVLDSAGEEDEGYFRKLVDNVQDSYGLNEEDSVQVVRTTIDAIRRILLEEYDELASELAGGESDFLERAQRVVVSQLGNQSFAAKLLYCFSVLRMQVNSERAEEAFSVLGTSIHLADIASLEDASLYKPKTAPKPISTDYEEIEKVDIQAMREHERTHTLKRPYSIHRANQYIAEKLGMRGEMLSSEIDLSTLDGRRQYVNIYLCQDTGDQFKYVIEQIVDKNGKPVLLENGGQKRPLYRIRRRD